MASNVILFGWNRSLPGRENLSSEHFNDFVEYLVGLQKSGSIENFEPVFLDPHGGDLNGFFLIRGDASDLAEVMASRDWTSHMTRATMHLQASGAVQGVSGEGVTERMEIWRENIPG